jgi:hypothetical protein
MKTAIAPKRAEYPEKQDFYPWQQRAIQAISGRNAILASPTGSGKTLVAYAWAGLMDRQGNLLRPDHRIIFTAPIKALSNERYLDLRHRGVDVGIETGDFKKGADSPVLCCTQEIYTRKYAHLPNQSVIVDEFHYIFSDPERSRAYIDGIRNTHPQSSLLVMSATFGKPDVVKHYLKTLTSRSFALVDNGERATKLTFLRKGIGFRDINNAIVFSFSAKGVRAVAERIAKFRKGLGRQQKSRIEEIARILEVSDIPWTVERGVGAYYGALYPKEKLFLETAFRENLLDVMVGTDALSLGVNLPARTVVFAQMGKYTEGPLKKNEFLQMAGRAGRKGYFDEGFASYLHWPGNPFELRGAETPALYRMVLDSPCEEAFVCLYPDMGALLRGERTCKEEAEYVAGFSLPRRSPGAELRRIEANLRGVETYISTLYSGNVMRNQFRSLLGDVWYGEMGVEANIRTAQYLFETERPEAMPLSELVKDDEKNALQTLLKTKRYISNLPNRYPVSGVREIEDMVDRMDPTVFGFEEILDILGAEDRNR